MTAVIEIPVSDLTVSYSGSKSVSVGSNITPSLVPEYKGNKLTALGTSWRASNSKAVIKSGKIKGIDPGKAKVTGTLTYNGNDMELSVSENVTVVPAGTVLKKIIPGKGKLTVSWKLQRRKTDGYQVQCSKDSAFSKGCKTVTAKNNSLNCKKITNLAKGKYYVRIRTYKTVSGTRYYSSWSAKKAVKVK